MLFRISHPKYKVGAYETSSVANPAMLTSIMLLSQSFAITDVRIRMMITTATTETTNNSKLQVLYKYGYTSIDVFDGSR